MANTLLLKRSSVAGKVPTTANLQYGELSLNYTDGTLYFKTNVNTIGSFVSNGSSLTANVLTVTGGIFWANGAVYSSGGGGGGSGSSTTSTTAPTSPSVGDNWYNPSTDIVYRYTYDGTSYYWVDISGPGVANITAVYGNANVASYLPTYTSNITAANVTVSAGIYSPGYFYANGQPFTSSSFGNTDVAGYLQTYTGNISAGNVYIGTNLTVAGTISSATLPLVLNDISARFNANTAVFALRSGQTTVASIVDSKDLTVSVDGRMIRPYVTELRFPWISPYDSYNGFRVVKTSGNARVGLSNIAQSLIIYNTPDIGQQATVIQVNTSTAQQTRRYPFSAATVALGD